MLLLLRRAATSAAARGTNITGIRSCSFISPRRNISSSTRAGAGMASDDDRAPPFVVAVDGPVASGKGTLARRLAAAFNLRYLDTGLLYRAVGAETLRQDVALDDEAAVAAVARSLDLTGCAATDADALRADAVASAASKVSALPAVRAALLQAQRDFAAGATGAVLDGRDIGTVVCPRASAKLFVTASAEVRAGRRLLELQERRRRAGEGNREEAGAEEPTLARVLDDLRARDARDAERQASPLRAADDALVLDTSAMDADAAFEAARAFVEGRRRRRKEGGREAGGG